MNKLKGSFKDNALKTFHILFLLIILLLALIPIQCPTTSSSPSQRAEEMGCGRSSRASTYTATKIHNITGSSLAGGVGSGNFDNDIYQELIFIGGASEGETTLVDYNLSSGEFESTVLWWDPNGGLIEIEVGELDNSNIWPEILVGGFSGNLTLLKYNSSGLINNVTIWNTTNYNHIFGIALGNITEQYPGNEIAVVDAYTQNLYIIYSDGNGWDDIQIPLSDVPRNVFIGDFDQAHIGNEVLVVCVGGSVFRVGHEKDQWAVFQIFQDTNSPLSAIVADLNSSHPGEEVVIASLSWNATLLWGNGTSWYNRTIWHAAGALEGVGYGDFDHLHIGAELCIAGYSNTAEMIYNTDLGWYNETIFYDPDPLQTELNGVLITDFYPANEGDELLVIGFKGPVWMLLFEPPDFRLHATQATKSITAGESDTFHITLTTISSYNSGIDLTVEGIPPKSTFSFTTSVLQPPSSSTQGKDSTVLTITTSNSTPGDIYNITITGTGQSDGKSQSIILRLNVKPISLPPPEPDFQLSIAPTSMDLNLDNNQYSSEFQIQILSINNFDKAVEISIPADYLASTLAKSKFSHKISPNPILPGQTAVLNITISKDVTNSIGLSIPIQVKNDELDLSYEEVIKLNVTYTKSKSSDGSESGDGLSQQWVSIVLMLIVIIIISLFLFKRMRDLSTADRIRKIETEPRVKQLDSGRKQRLVRRPRKTSKDIRSLKKTDRIKKR